MVTVVVPLDGSEVAERALRPACALAARLEDARVQLVSCDPDDAAEVQEHLEDRAGLFVPTVDVDIRIVETEPAEGILEVVVPDEQVAFPDEPVRNREVEAAEARLGELAARMETPISTARTTVLHSTPASRSIVGFAARLPAALIAMATHGRTGLVRTAVGGVATEVVRHAPCPVLVSRPQRAAGT